MTTRPSAETILAALDEADAVTAIAAEVLENGGASNQMQIAIATTLRSNRRRIADLASELDAWIEEQDKAGRPPLPMPEQVRSELAILDEIRAIDAALKTVEVRE